MSDIAIRADHLSKKFTVGSHMRAGIKDRLLRKVTSRQEIWAIRDASFELERGQSLGIIGHNGAGKSTALKVFAGIYLPTSGTVEVNGRVSALLELGAGFHPNLTGRENIQLNGAILGMSRRQIRAAEDDIIDFADIGSAIDLPVKTYSSGMNMRLGFAITAKLDPDILIVDEIIAVGDESFRLKCNAYMESLREAGTTIMMVSHALPTVTAMCDVVVWLDHGKVVGYGPASEVVDAYVSSVVAKRLEAATRAGAADQLLPHDGLVEVTRVQAFTSEGALTTTIPSGYPLKLRIHHSAKERHSGVTVALHFRSLGGMPGVVPVTVTSKSLDVDEGDGFVDYDISFLTLVPGVYSVSASVASGDEQLHRLGDALELKVVAPGAKSGGPAVLPGSWSS